MWTMTGIRRWTVLGAVLAVLGAVACAGGGTPVAGTTSAVTQTTSPHVTPTASGTGSGALEAGTLYFIGPAGSAGGIYTLHNGVLTRIFANSTAAFRQSGTIGPVTPSHEQYIVWVDNDTPGGTGVLKVHNVVSNVDTTITLWSTITNAITPQFTPDGDEADVAYSDGGGMHEGEINLPSNGAGYNANFWSPCCLHLISAYGDYSILGGVGSANLSLVVLSNKADPPVTLVAPSGQEYVWVQSLAWDGTRGIARLQTTGSPLAATRTFAANAYVDYTNGTSLPVPGGGTLKGGVYYWDHQLALRLVVNGNDVMRLISPLGAVAEDYELPTSVAGLDFLTWSP
jgi:hypothetical protein